MNTRLILGTTIMGGLLLTSACSMTVADMGSDISGQVTGTGDQTIMVYSPNNNSSDRFVIELDEDVEILISKDRVNEPGNITDVNIGQQVEIWIIGGIMESYPARAVAKKIVIVGEGVPDTVPPLAEIN